MKSRYKKIIIGFVFVGLIVIGILFNKTNDNEIEGNIPINVNDEVYGTQIVIEIKGEVNKPGLYYLDSESRINDAIILAGGFTSKANTSTINLASKLTDGMVIYVDTKNIDNNNSKISINTATLDQLMTLSGIGESKARNIINYRLEKGKFKTLEELKNVSGISENIFEQIKEFICL